MSSSILSSRRYHFSVGTNGSAFYWGGRLTWTQRIQQHIAVPVFSLLGQDLPLADVRYLSEVDIRADKWKKHLLKGQHPPGVCSGACAVVGDNLYFYGGVDNKGQVTGSLFGLNLSTKSWMELSRPGTGGPKKKRACGMVDYNFTLIIYGGDADDGLTNELHMFDLCDGTWSSPDVTGDVPPPDSAFTFTKVSNHQVVLRGKWQNEDIYVLDLSRMHWKQRHNSGPEVLAMPYLTTLIGYNLVAACLGLGSDHAQLLLLNSVGYAWLLDVATWRLMKIESPFVMRIPYYCKATVIQTSPTSAEVVVSGETIIRFKFMKRLSIPEDISPVQWWIPTAYARGMEKYKSEADEDQDFPIKPEFSAEIKKSIVYKGEKSSCVWDEGGFEMTFHQSKESHSEEARCFLQMSDTAGPCSRLPDTAKSVGRYYHISSSKRINTAITLKIFYRRAEYGADQLYFLTCTDLSPPYNYQILDGGNFTSTYGEITVETFSFYTICRLFLHYGLRGILANMENKFKASLYRSNQPTPQSRWNIYLVVVKDDDVFSHSVKTYIQDNYNESVTLVTEQVVSLCDNVNCVTTSHNMETNSPQNISFYEPDQHTLNHVDIRDYVDGCPPLVKYSIGCSGNCSFNIKFMLDGVEEPKCFTLRESDLPDITRNEDDSKATAKLQKYISSIQEQYQKNLEEPIDEEILCAVAKSLHNWDTKYDLLKLVYDEMKNIKEENSSVLSQRIAALNHWKNRVGPDGTYRNLLRILALGDWHDSAKELIAFINNESHNRRLARGVSEQTGRNLHFTPPDYRIWIILPLALLLLLHLLWQQFLQ